MEQGGRWIERIIEDKNMSEVKEKVIVDGVSILGGYAMTESFAQLLREEEEQNKLRIQEELKLREENSHNNFLIMNWRNRNYTFRDRELDTDKNILRIIGIQRHKVNCPTCNGKGIINGEKCPSCKTNPHVSKGSGYTFLVNNQPCIHEWTFGYTNQSSRLSNAVRICIHCGYNYDNYTD